MLQSAEGFVREIFRFWIEELRVQSFNFGLLPSQMVLLSLLELLFCVKTDLLGLNFVFMLNFASKLTQLSRVLQVLLLRSDLELSLHFKLFGATQVLLSLVLSNLFEDCHAFLQFLDKLCRFFQLRLRESVCLVSL